MVVVDLKVRNKNRKMSREQSEEEDGVVGTEVGPASDGNRETDVEFRPPRGTNGGEANHYGSRRSGRGQALYTLANSETYMCTGVHRNNRSKT